MPGGYGKGRRHRWWYRKTGMPGWMTNRYGPWDDPRYEPGYDMIPPEDMPPLYPPSMGYPPYMPRREPTLSPRDELKMLEEEEQMLGEELEELKKRIVELRKEVK